MKITRFQPRSSCFIPAIVIDTVWVTPKENVIGQTGDSPKLAGGAEVSFVE